MSFLDALANSGVIKKTEIDDVKSLAAEKYNGDIEGVLLDQGVPEETILAEKGKYLKIPTRKVSSRDVSFEALKYIPEDSAIYYRFVPIGFSEGVLEGGVTDPENLAAMDALQFISAKLGIPFKIFLISKNDYEAVREAYKAMSVQMEEPFLNYDSASRPDEELKSAHLEKPGELQKPGEEAKIVEDAPIIKIVSVIIKNAIESNASDIHIEHAGANVKVRYRVDGVLHTSLLLPVNVYSGIIARIKLLSKLRLDEKRKPQDGSFGTEVDGRKIDFRVSTMPAYYGEKVAMRILDSEKGVKPLGELGLSKRNLEMIRNAIKKPYGLILITGPTGPEV